MSDFGAPPYTQLVPAQDWFYVFESEGRPVALRIALWGVSEEDEVVGLIGLENSKAGQMPRLHAVPAVKGQYLHLDQLSPEERVASKRR